MLLWGHAMSTQGISLNELTFFIAVGGGGGGNCELNKIAMRVFASAHSAVDSSKQFCCMQHRSLP
jgi:hypothetical protein